MSASRSLSCPSAASSEDDQLLASPLAVDKAQRVRVQEAHRMPYASMSRMYDGEKLTVERLRDMTEGTGDSTEDHFLETIRSSALSTAAGTSRPLPEIEAAELENRLRDFTTWLITPMVRKQARLEREIEAMRRTLEESGHRLKEVEQAAEKMHEQAASTENFRSDLAKWEANICDISSRAAVDAVRIRQEMDAVSDLHYKQNAASHGMQRTLDRVVGEVARWQETSEVLRQYMNERLANNSKVLSEVTTNLECKVTELELRSHRASDEFFELRTLCAAELSRIDSTSKAVASLSNDMRHLQHEKASISQLETLQEEVNTMVSSADSNLTAMLRTMNGMVEDMKAHFDTAANATTVQTETMLADFRGAWQQETKQSSQLRSVVASFMEQMEQSMKELESRVEISSERAADLVRQVSNDVENHERSRKFKLDSQEATMQSSQEQLSNLRGVVDKLSTRAQSMMGILSILLQCESAASALDVQDCTDRASVALMAYGDATSAAGSNSRSPNKSVRAAATIQEECGMQSAQAGKEGKKVDAVMSIDNRCMSCCAEKQQVLAGFKLACMNYAPGPVRYSDKTYMRQDLVDWREKLVHTAQEQMRMIQEDAPSSRRATRLRNVFTSSVPKQPSPRPSLRLLQPLNIFQSEPISARTFGSCNTSHDTLPALTQ